LVQFQKSKKLKNNFAAVCADVTVPAYQLYKLTYCMINVTSALFASINEE